MQTDYRLNFFVDEVRKILIFRVIGAMPGPEFTERLFESYAKVEKPWTFHRVIDMRRFEGLIAFSEVEEMARRWKELKNGEVFHTRVAIVSADALDAVRVPTASPLFPEETLCHFNDYHEAMAWICSGDEGQMAAAG